MKKRMNLIAIILPMILCTVLTVTGKLEGNFEYSQTYLLLYLCISDILKEKR